MVASSFFMTWHMQQEDRLKMMTGCSEIRRWIRASVVSSKSMDKEEEEEEFVMVVVVVVVEEAVRSRWTASSEQWRNPCIAVHRR